MSRSQTQNIANGATAVTAQRLPIVVAGSITASAGLTFIHGGGAHSTGSFNFVSSYVDASNFLWITVIQQGTPSTVFKKSTAGGRAVTLGTKTYTDAGISTSVDPQAKTYSISHVGNNVTFTVGTATAAYTLSQADSDLFATGSQAGFWGNINDHS